MLSWRRGLRAALCRSGFFDTKQRHLLWQSNQSFRIHCYEEVEYHNIKLRTNFMKLYSVKICKELIINKKIDWLIGLNNWLLTSVKTINKIRISLDLHCKYNFTLSNRVICTLYITLTFPYLTFVELGSGVPPY